MDFFLVLFLLLAISCQDSRKNKLSSLVKKWSGKEILFPTYSVFTIQGKDTVDFDFSHSTYKVVMYVDSIGCIACKLQLYKWKRFIKEICAKKRPNIDIAFIFYFFPKDKRALQDIMRRESFTYPVCFDEKDEFNKLNHVPSEVAFQTLLLDNRNTVIAVGNPIHNLKVRKLYQKLLGSEDVLSERQALTTAKLNVSDVNLGTILKTEKHEQEVKITNTGTKPLVIQDVNTSCGCIAVEFSNEPIAVGGETVVRLIYNADKNGYFRKTIDIHCNVATSPLQIIITGNVEENSEKSVI